MIIIIGSGEHRLPGNKDLIWPFSLRSKEYSDKMTGCVFFIAVRTI